MGTLDFFTPIVDEPEAQQRSAAKGKKSFESSDPRERLGVGLEVFPRKFCFLFPKQCVYTKGFLR